MLNSFACRLLFVMFFASIVCCGVVYTTQAEQKSKGLPDIEAKSLTIKGEKGAGSVSIVATNEGPGIWLTAPNGDLICITALGRDGGRTVCFMKKHEDGFKAANLAMSMTSDGEGLIQFTTSKGNMFLLPLEKLANLPADKLTELVK